MRPDHPISIPNNNIVVKYTNSLPIRSQSRLGTKRHLPQFKPKYSRAITSQQILQSYFSRVYTPTSGQHIVFKQLLKVVEQYGDHVFHAQFLGIITKQLLSRLEPAALSAERHASCLKFIKSIVTSMAVKGKPSHLERAATNNSSAIPVHYPMMTLVIALVYIERIVKSFSRNQHGVAGCTNRIFLTAYVIAAKYIHINFISCSDEKPSEPSEPSKPSKPSKPLIVMASTTKTLCRIFPDIAAHEFYHMELDLVTQLQYDLNVQFQTALAWIGISPEYNVNAYNAIMESISPAPVATVVKVEEEEEEEEEVKENFVPIKRELTPMNLGPSSPQPASPLDAKAQEPTPPSSAIQTPTNGVFPSTLPSSARVLDFSLRAITIKQESGLSQPLSNSTI